MTTLDELVKSRKHVHRRDYSIAHRIKILEVLRDDSYLIISLIMQKAALSWKDTTEELSFLQDRGFVCFTKDEKPNCRKIGYYSITQSGLDILEAVKPLV